MIEHKIGEVFECEGKKLQCIKNEGCIGCYYEYNRHCNKEKTGGCHPRERNDSK